MSRKKDLLIIAGVLAVALVLFLISKAQPQPTTENRTADVTLAPDSIEYLEDTPSPETETAEPKTAESVSAADADIERTAEPAMNAAQAESAGEETVSETSEPDVSEKFETAAVSAETSEADDGQPDSADRTAADSADEPAAETGESGKTSEQTDSGALYGPQLSEPEEAVAGYVIITVQGRQYGDPIPMDREKIITVRQDAHTINRIHISRESVYMESSTCDNQDCVGEGEVTLENYKTRILGNYIICLPNGVQVEMIPAETE